MGGRVGGGLRSAGWHGNEDLGVQRILAVRNLANARRAMIGSGVLVIAQFALFLLVGVFIWAAGGAVDESLQSDRIFPQFVVDHLPVGLAGLVIAGVLAAAMSTVSSSLNSLASATTHDFYAAITGRRDPQHLLKVGRWATLAWAVVLMGGALAFWAFRSQGTPVVVLALSVASIAYGGLLGTFIMAGLMPR